MQVELNYPNRESAKENTLLFQESIAQEKKNKKSPYTVSADAQIKANVIRQYQGNLLHAAVGHLTRNSCLSSVLWGDQATFIVKQGSTLVQALVAGSLFFNAPNNSSGLFIKSGALCKFLLQQ